MNRAERRREKQEKRITSWIQHPSPKQLKQGSGWFGELDRVFRSEDSQYVVMIRTVDTAWGKVEHACIRNAASTDISWSEKQRIKNEIFGKEATAIEVFPGESQLVDEANMYHLWVLPADVKLPFGLSDQQAHEGKE